MKLFIPNPSGVPSECSANISPSIMPMKGAHIPDDGAWPASPLSFDIHERAAEIGRSLGQRIDEVLAAAIYAAIGEFTLQSVSGRLHRVNDGLYCIDGKPLVTITQKDPSEWVLGASRTENVLRFDLNFVSHVGTLDIQRGKEISARLRDEMETFRREYPIQPEAKNAN